MDERMMLPGRYPKGPLTMPNLYGCGAFLIYDPFFFFFFFFCPFRINIYICVGGIGEFARWLFSRLY